MLDYIEAAGWGVYPVFWFGLPALFVAIRQVLDPNPRRVTTVLWLSGLTLLAGVLGMATGLQFAGQFILAQTQPEWTSMGVALTESFGNLVISLFIVIATFLLMLMSHLRSGPAAAEASGATAPAHAEG